MPAISTTRLGYQKPLPIRTAPRHYSKREDEEDTRTPIAVSGLPGRMATAVAERIERSKDFKLQPHALSGDTLMVETRVGRTNVTLYPPGQRDLFWSNIELPTNGGLIVDFTTSIALLINAPDYIAHKCNLVIGTTGKFDSLKGMVWDAKLSAVISPNMAAPIAMFQGIVEDFAKANKMGLEGCKLSITESHQRRKEGTSATAERMLTNFGELGMVPSVSFIKSIRNVDEQRAYGVPEEHWGWHAWHTYNIVASTEQQKNVLGALGRTIQRFMLGSSVFESYDLGQSRTIYDESIERAARDNSLFFRMGTETLTANPKWGGLAGQMKLSITHNTNGGDSYADGALDALRFLRGKNGSNGVYSMMHVLRSMGY